MCKIYDSPCLPENEAVRVITSGCLVALIRLQVYQISDGGIVDAKD